MPIQKIWNEVRLKKRAVSYNQVRRVKIIMLSKPYSGWTDFQLEGTDLYGLSYLDDIAINWLDACIYGMENLLPFCVKGYMEPGRFLCTVSYWNCHIITEYDERRPLIKEKDIQTECSHTSMIEFCRYLYNDISADIEGWAGFVDYVDADIEKQKQLLNKKLERLKELISENEEYFDEKHCFL